MSLANKGKEHWIAVVNPGSTSTKAALYKGPRCVMERSVSHPIDFLRRKVPEQVYDRHAVITELFAEVGITPKHLSAVAARGGRLRPVRGGVYTVNQAMLLDTLAPQASQHASALAVLIGIELSRPSGCSVYVVDPISVDEMLPAAQMSGTPLISRFSMGHALNTKEVCRRVASTLERPYEELNLVIAHLGGGTTVSAHRKGLMVDLINDFEGGFTPERSGGLPVNQLVALCFSGQFSEEELQRKIEGEGGFYAYLGTKNVAEVVQRAQNGDTLASEVLDAYLLQLGKSIAAMLSVLDFHVDALCITGGMAHSPFIVNHLREKFVTMLPFYVYPGSFEMEALATQVLAVLNGEKCALSYPDGKELRRTSK